MDSTGKWETVVNKKKSHVTKSDIKKAQQKFVDGTDTPKVDTRDPLKLEQTSYAAGFAKKRFHESDSDDDKYPSRVPFDQLDSKSPRNAKRKEKKLHKQPPPVDMTTKLEKIPLDILKEKIIEVQNKFPSSQLIWLKDITGWLHLQLTGPNEKGDIAYISKSEDYPLCDVPSGVKSTLKKIISICDKNVLNSFFTYLLASLTTDVQQGRSTVADRFLIQLLCSVKPNLVAENCDEAVFNKSRNGDSYLAIIWALSQGNSTLKKNLGVWWSAMFSTLDKKHHAAAAMNYLVKVLDSVDRSNVTAPLITSDQILQLIEVMVSENSVMIHTPSLMETLRTQWGRLVNLLLGDQAQIQGKTVFADILPTLRNQEDIHIRNKVCELLVQCLALSPTALTWWEENLIHHMRESSVLLKYIQSNSETVTIQVNKCHRSNKALLHSAQRFVERLEKANERGKFEKKPGYRDCRKLCLAYIRHESSRKQETSIFWKLFKLSLLVLITLVTYDLYVHQGYKGSRTNIYLHKYGVEQRASIAFDRVSTVTDSARRYCEKHVPYYYSKVSIYIEPVLEVTWKYVTIATQFIYTQSRPLREYANRVIPPLLEQISFFLSEQYRIISTFILSIYNYYTPIIQEFIVSVYTWLIENIPLAYRYIVNLLITLRLKVYEISPETFDQLAVTIADAWKYVVKTTPVVMGTIEDYVNRGIVTSRQYVQEGQTWFQQTLSNVSPSAAK